MDGGSWLVLQLLLAVHWGYLPGAAPAVPSPLLGSTAGDLSNSGFGYNLPQTHRMCEKYEMSPGRVFELFL